MKAKRFIFMLLVMLMSVTGAWAQMTFIKEIKISVGGESSSQEKLTKDGYTIVQGLTNTKSKDLNNGGGGEFVYLGYKTTTNPAEAITGIYIVQSRYGTGLADTRGTRYKTYKLKDLEPGDYYRCDSYGDEPRDCDLNRGRDDSADITLYYTKYKNNSHGGTPLTEIKIADNKNATGYQYTPLHVAHNYNMKNDEPYGNTNQGGDSDDPPHYIVFKTHTHNVSATFNWAADGKTCTANISCGCGMSSNNVRCDITSNVIQEPTCTTDGVRVYTAKVNRYGKDFSDTKNLAINRLGHEILTHHDRVEATCTQDGNYEYWTCSRACCDGIYYKDAEGTVSYDAYPVIDALGHLMTHHDRVEATCTQDGNHEYWTCSRACCDGIYYKDAEGTESYDAYPVINRGHIMTHHEHVEYCTENGHYEYWVCSRASCEGLYFRDAVGAETYDTYPVLAPQGHAMVHHAKVEATPTQDGHYEYWTCSRACCNGILYKDAEGAESYSEYPVIPSPHSFTLTLDKQGGAGGDNQVTFDVGAEMPTITVPTREGFGFNGYYAGENGTGTKYYNADGTSAHPWDQVVNRTLYAYWKEPVSYVVADGTIQYINVYDEITSTDAVKTLSTGWYVVKEADVQTQTLVCEGTVNLILQDGAKLTATGGEYDAGIRVSAEGASLTIYGQQDQTGELIAKGYYYCAGIGGGYDRSGHDITINGGVITATGGRYGSGIGGGYGGGASNIFVNSSLVLYADGNNSPTTLTEHTSAEDVSGKLSGKQYVIVRKPMKEFTVTFDKQGGNGGNDQITVDEAAVMPTITVPTRTGFTFNGYYAGENGMGTKYFNADGTSAHLWDKLENSTLYASWKIPVSYIDVDGTTKYAGADEITTTTTKLRSGWYVVLQADVQTGTIVCEGNVHLILADGAKLTATAEGANAGIRVSAKDASLTIYGQSEQTGQLIANGGGWGAGIGCATYAFTGIGNEETNITINGGKVTATGGESAPGIGTRGDDSSAFHITINGGKVIAAGGYNSYGIGGTFHDPGSYIIVNGGVISASGGERKFALGGHYEVDPEYENEHEPCSYNIFVNSSLVLYADGNNPPTTVIEHTSVEDISGKLSGKQHAIVRKPTLGITVTFDKQGGIGGDDQVTVDEVAAMPTITVPTINDYTFVGYFSGQDGTGIKYYNSDGTSAHLCYLTENTTLYAYWVHNCVVTLDTQGGNGGTSQITANYDTPMPTITVPTRDDYIFNGYYAGQNGTGTKYYNADGTSARLWDIKENNITLYACWNKPQSYVDVDGTTKYLSLYETINNATTTLTADWYVVSGEDVQTSTLVCEGEVHLILADGAKLTATGGSDDAGIRVSAEGASLFIYGQTEQTGQLIANGGSNAAGIGGSNSSDGHDITINGGVITANGGYLGAGIGSGYDGSGHDITINGGIITANGGNYSAGIGAGFGRDGHDITINGGVITATGGYRASGIGGGIYGYGDDITINGGVITVAGGDRGGPAIGGGYNGSASNIFVNAAVILNADGNATPTTEIEHTSSEDLASALNGKRYATIALPSVKVNHAPELDANFSTFYHKYADYTVPNDDATIYTAAVEDYQGETCLVLREIKGGVIPANTAVIVRTEESTTIDLQPCADASGITVPANSLSGANLPMDAPDFCYILSYGQHGLGFYKYAEENALAAHKAYLTYKPGSAGAKALRMVFADDNEVDGIQRIENGEFENENSVIYNLNGMRLDKLQKGINIVNGKKVIVK